MYIRMNRDMLIPVLGRVGGVVERRHTLPILGNFLLVAGEDSVQITGTDLEVEIRTRFAAQVDSAGDLTVPARKFVDICRALADGVEVSIESTIDRASIVAGRSRFSLSILPANDFPIMEGAKGTNLLGISQGRLKRLLDKTAFAMAHQDVRYYLNGLLLEIKGDRLVAVATDGHRLAKVEEIGDTGVEKDLQIILPRKTVMELNRLLVADSEDQARIDFSERVFRISSDDTVLTSKLIDGRYPDYEKVIPRAANRVAVADRESLRQALLRTSILSNEKYKGVRLSFEQNQLRLQAHNPEQEEAEEELEIEYDEVPTSIGFNVGYLLDVLNVLRGDDVELCFSDSNSSAVVRNRGEKHETYVVMPMRL